VIIFVLIFYVFSLFRLTKFEATFCCSDEMKCIIFSFFSSQKNLKIIRLKLLNCEEDFIKKLTFHILRNCHMLRDVKFEDYQQMIKFRPNEFREFLCLISNLVSLSLKFNILGEST